MRSSATRQLALLSAAYVLVSGYVHLTQWLDGYRRIPLSVHGAWVVAIGFPVAAVSALVIATALALGAARLPRLLVPSACAAAMFAAGSVALVVATRFGSVFGWSEPSWSIGAKEALAVEIAALVFLGLAAVAARVTPARRVAALA